MHLHKANTRSHANTNVWHSCSRVPVGVAWLVYAPCFLTGMIGGESVGSGSRRDGRRDSSSDNRRLKMADRNSLGEEYAQ